MYRAVELAAEDSDFHRFFWRNDSNQLLRDIRKTRVTFGVSASPFAANMALRQNALDNAVEYPLAAEIVQTSFYVDDELTEQTQKMKRKISKGISRTYLTRPVFYSESGTLVFLKC